MSRAAAYGELVAGILDVRDATPTRRFDDAIRDAVAAGRLDPRTAAELRWLQRESLQALVEHARISLPAALLGIDEARAGSQVGETAPHPEVGDRPEPLGEPPQPEAPPLPREAAPARNPVWATVPLRHEAPAPASARAGAATPPGPGPLSPGSADLPPDAEPPEATQEPEVRRLLVAGLTSLTGPTLHG
jgi:hypothetical protein